MAQEKLQQSVNAAECIPVAIPGTEQRCMRSLDGSRTYRIFIAKPFGEQPPAGYPVIYLLDANSVFGTMVEALRMQSRRPDKTGVGTAVIVGIGYETDAPFDRGRYYDFTLPESGAELPMRPDGADWPEPGGAKAFLSFIEQQLKPEIEQKFTIDVKRQAIFGHSLGGLFVLQTLFTKPDLFQTYIAGSPSIHWHPSFFDKEHDFVSKLQEADGDVKVLLGAGELEKTHKSGMNDNAKRLADRLAALESQGVRAEYHEFKGEGHISVLPVLISRALRFAFKPD
ncbi:alpha/beta hydrolase [Bacillus licheniformis]|uniref:alpha/beta hydrolase n=1 Tax=Bacillus licheniformis TaxID=1402 RepID=UPI00084B669B|nr:alpha/beta hydrolase [Bacillus licheniformis]AOP17128.1 Ferri-bacillibactin esterase BesA [Bacillus licheniformis]QAW30851.1 alpha/beta hydrolase [Bacillus licheniformis]